MAQQTDENHPEFVGPPKPTTKGKAKKDVITIKLDVPNDVIETMRELSQLSGMSQRRIMRQAIDHAIKIYALHYGLAEYATFEEKMPPEKLTTAHVKQVKAQEAKPVASQQPQYVPPQHPQYAPLQQPQYVPPQHPQFAPPQQPQLPEHQPVWPSEQRLHPYASDGIQRDEYTFKW